MRELKFRAWSDKYGMYKVGCLVTEEGTWSFAPKDKNFIGVSMPYQPFFIIEQATGIRDKNEKMIYEGDIVEHDVYHVGIKAYRSKSEVFISDLGVRIREDKNDEECSLLRHCTNIEVVGNIHDTYELLLEEDKNGK